MYVLHHADKPSLYAGLPDNPHISPLVGVWKGVLKPISLAAIAFAGAFGLMHYVTKGPNRVVRERRSARRPSWSRSDEGMTCESQAGQPLHDGRPHQSLDHARYRSSCWR